MDSVEHRAARAHGGDGESAGSGAVGVGALPGGEGGGRVGGLKEDETVARAVGVLEAGAVEADDARGAYRG